MMSDMIQGLCFSIAMMTGFSRTDTGIKMIYAIFVVHNNNAVGTWTL
jgi:acid phosphatase family membrane protein YuiD